MSFDPITVTLDEEERQLVLLALAVLSLNDRWPGYAHNIRKLSQRFAGEGMYESFRACEQRANEGVKS